MAEPYYLDLLISHDEDGTVTLSTDDLCLQWRMLPDGGLRAMLELLTSDDDGFSQVLVGEILGTTLYLIHREGVMSFKASSADLTLIRVDLSTEMVSSLIVAIRDELEEA